jgi:pteridine reductase
MTQKPTALITGAAKRVGAEIARELASAGYQLALHYRSSETAVRSLAEELSSQTKVLCLKADLNDVAAPNLLIEQTLAHFGRLDALINNASSFYPTPLGEISLAQFDDLFASNARAPLFLSQAAAAALTVHAGAIINIVDIYAERPLPRYLPYCMAKAALLALTFGLARELGPSVRVNAIAPGNILWSENMEKAETPQVVLERTTLKRSGEPRDIAKAVQFLLSQGYISGEVLRVDGGRFLYI